MPASVIAAALILSLSLLACSFNDERSKEDRTITLSVSEVASAPLTPPPSDTLRVVTLNLAHGRKGSLNQWFVNEQETRANLDDIARYLRDIDADVVALQEADRPSRWSGNFDHVAYLASKAGIRYYLHTEHANIWMGNYGTAILSRWPVKEAIGLDYARTPPTASKGFTLGLIEWRHPDKPETTIPINVISVHLDFSRKSIRRQQIEELSTIMEQRVNPLIVMGDFNSEWLAKEYLVNTTTESSRLQVFDPGSETMNTYKDKRLDWILISRRLTFANYMTEQEMYSDHKVVVADIQGKFPL